MRNTFDVFSETLPSIITKEWDSYSTMMVFGWASMHLVAVFTNNHVTVNEQDQRTAVVPPVNSNSHEINFQLYNSHSECSLVSSE